METISEFSRAALDLAQAAVAIGQRNTFESDIMIRRSAQLAQLALDAAHSDPSAVRAAKMRALICEALTTDGAHHKQWFLEELWVYIQDGSALPNHEAGIAP